MNKVFTSNLLYSIDVKLVCTFIIVNIIRYSDIYENYTLSIDCLGNIKAFYIVKIICY